MTDKDAITLPRELVEQLVHGWGGNDYWSFRRAMAELRAALAAEPTKPEPVAVVGTQSNAAWKGYDGRWAPPGDPIKVVHPLRDLPLGTLLYTASNAAMKEDEA